MKGVERINVVVVRTATDKVYAEVQPNCHK